MDGCEQVLPLLHPAAGGLDEGGLAEVVVPGDAGEVEPAVVVEDDGPDDLPVVVRIGEGPLVVLQFEMDGRQKLHRQARILSWASGRAFCRLTMRPFFIKQWALWAVAQSSFRVLLKKV